ncbi:Tat pathway signal sequence domain protein [Streptomyces sp. SAT1]|uniref:DUF4429 domain-containing protein n=1 Tax=Streptomyces sp. SAT1 TaxID=1849967 RepID=UPI0007DE1F25|nr:DUF4429 domain-containing protein [Streptomyces sp. SAT1]ANH91656.1 Tat pathway signal sequence domain protein [Streptomyces sp. SAT1]
MAEIIQKDGAWAFDGDALRLTPGRDRNISVLRRTLGELRVPLRALAGISFEQGKRAGRLRLRLRDGADPLLHATGGRLAEPHDPYQLLVEPDRFGVAEYVADEVRNALLLEQVPTGPVTKYLLPGPAVPLSVSAGDGTASFDGERIRLEWNWKTEDAKAAAGPRVLTPADLTGVEWLPAAGLENGHLRLAVRGAPDATPPKYDPNAVELWGFKKDPLMALVAAAIQARLPHPAAAAALAPGPDAAGADVGADGPAVLGTGRAAPHGAPPAEDEHDALLRRLRELGELHRSGVLTEEEFALAKQAVLKRM